jgi:hypothetical protein
MMRPIILSVILSGSLLFPAALLQAQEAVYKAPEGEAPPVAPPLKKGSPLDHLANDPRQDTPTIGYKEGHTAGVAPYVGHRLPDAMGGQGWGWVKKNGEKWDSAKWIALQETLGVAVAPHRKLFKSDADSNWEYKIWGKWASYKAYDPRMDEELPVFILQGYEVIGPQPPLSNKMGAPDRIQHKPSGASSRDGRPILSDPGVD